MGKIIKDYTEIRPIDAFSLFKLDLLSSDEIVALSNSWLENGIYSDSLCELCTMVLPIMSDISPLFEQSMNDLRIDEPTIFAAAEGLIRFTLTQVVEKKIEPEKGASFLYYEIHLNLSNEYPDKEFVGDIWGLESIFCWLREIWDCKDG
ncbi:MAG: hypothetical protein GY756_15365, partial [bacterium]|nr:hypothetical protein [bacterium]